MKNQLLIVILLLFIPFVQGQNDLINEGSIRFYEKDSSGISRMYYENGQVEKEGEFVKNKVCLFISKVNVHDGLWKFFYENGNLKARGKYDKGDKEGLWEFYNEEGELMRVVFYKKNRIVDKRIYIDEILLWEDDDFQSKRDVYFVD